MRESRLTKAALLGALVVSLIQLAACAADPRYQLGSEWIQSNELEKARLDRAGFPQYVDGP